MSEGLRLGERFRFARTPGGAVGLALAGFVIALAIFGPFFAAHTPTETVGNPGLTPGAGVPLGTDFLGRDALSRVLWGGRSILVLATLATSLAYLLGTSIGLAAGYLRSHVEELLMRAMDVLRAFPALLLLLLLVSGVGTGKGVLVFGVALVQVPGISRLVYTATLQTASLGFVEAAVARGEGTFAILRREVFPNILGPILADLGLRFTFSILFIAGVTFLGLGLQPPAADWSLMINENRSLISINPYVVFVPAALIAALTIGVNLIGDAIVRSFGRSGDSG
ncbi:MAG: ABC transporter permease [Solirubrobacterales bacterium]